jgi:hypothetical protein
MDKLPPKSPEALALEATVTRLGRTQPANLRDCVQPESMKMWPTPQARDYKGPSGRSMKGEENDLPNQVKFATPKSRDWKGQSQRGIHAQGYALPNMDRGDGQPIGGQLNPQFVAWLMGWPLNWTSMEPLPQATWDAWERAFHTGRHSSNA